MGSLRLTSHGLCFASSHKSCSKRYRKRLRISFTTVIVRFRRLSSHLNRSLLQVARTDRDTSIGGNLDLACPNASPNISATYATVSQLFSEASVAFAVVTASAMFFSRNVRLDVLVAVVATHD